MARCEFRYEDGRQCGAMALTAVEAPGNDGRNLCWNHSIDESIVARRQESRRRGGRQSRKIEPWRIEEIEPIEDTIGLKRLLNSCLIWLTTGAISPSQARAVVVVANGLRDALELELYRELADLKAELTGEPEPGLLEGEEAWRLLQD